MSKKISWITEKRIIKELIPHTHNPRQMTEKQVKDLTESLKKFNLAEIPAINTDNTILAGHQRLKIMSILGREQEEIDVRVPTRELTEKEAKEYLIRSNKNTGEWDFDLLANHFDEEMLVDIGFDIDELLGKIGDEVEPDPEADEVPDVQESTNIKLGDMFQLGEHRLLCGDATKKEDVERLMGGGQLIWFSRKCYMSEIDPIYCQVIIDRYIKYTNKEVVQI